MKTTIAVLCSILIFIAAGEILTRVLQRQHFIYNFSKGEHKNVLKLSVPNDQIRFHGSFGNTKPVNSYEFPTDSGWKQTSDEFQGKNVEGV
jgi:hypothetical protein